MVNISAKRTTISHLRQLSAEKTTTYGVGNPCNGLGQAQQCVRIKLVNGI